MGKIRAILLFSFFAIIALKPLKAQPPDYHIQLFNEKNGLHSFLMQAVIRDKNDFTWILYRDRIQRFDGKMVKEFALKERLYSLACDEQNRIWAVSRSAIFLYHDDHKGFVKIEFDTVGKTILGSFLNLLRQPVIHANNGFYVFDAATNQFKKIAKGGLSFSQPMNVAISAAYKNTVFVVSQNYLYAINSISGLSRKLPVKGDVRKLCALTEDCVLLGYWSSDAYWYDFRNNSVTQIDIGKELKTVSKFYFRIYDVLQLNEHEYLISSVDDFLLYNINNNSFRKLKLFMDGRALHYRDNFADLYIDREKNIWGVFDFGLVVFIPEEGHFGLLRNSETGKSNPLSNQFRGFAEDEKGNLWMATHGFAYLDIEKWEIKNFQPDLTDTTTFSHPSVRGIAYDGRYVILGPTDRGAWLYDIKNKSYRRPLYPPGEAGKKLQQRIESDFIDHISTLRNGNHIFSAGNGFYLMNGKNYLIDQINFPQEKENGNFSFQDSEGKVWLGTSAGLHCFDSTINYLFKVPYTMGNNSVHSMAELQPGEYLVGLSNSLYWMKERNKKVVQVGKLDSFFDGRIINFIFKDRKEKIWVGTDEALCCYDQGTKKIIAYDYFDNIQGNSFNQRSFIRTKKGIMFLGGYNGINYFKPETIKSRNDSLQATITRVVVNGNDTSYNNKKNFRLRPFQNSIEVDFVAPYFNDANRVQYRYWLKGLDEKWIENGNSNTIRFTSIAAGNYEFKVAASIDGEHWFEAKNSFSFMLLPPFWKTWWFSALVVIVVSLSVYALYKYQLNKRLEVERLRSRISRDLHDDIGSTLSSINILAKSSFAKNNDRGEQQNMVLQKIQHRSQKMLDAMDDLIWSTKPENDSLESLIVRMREYSAEVLEAAGINYILDCPITNNLKLSMQQKKNLYLIFKEAVNNLAKYSKAQNAFIRFEEQRNALQMIIRDEGIGFTNPNGKKGNGLENMRSRAVEINARLEIDSEAHEGTTIRVNVPI